MNGHGQDTVPQILDRIASGRYVPSDLERLRALTVTGDRNHVQIGKYNVELQHGRDIHVGDRIYHGIGAEKIRSVLDDLIYVGQIAPGSLRFGFSGVIMTIGYLIGTAGSQSSCLISWLQSSLSARSADHHLALPQASASFLSA